MSLIVIAKVFQPKMALITLLQRILVSHQLTKVFKRETLMTQFQRNYFFPLKGLPHNILNFFSVNAVNKQFNSPWIFLTNLHAHYTKLYPKSFLLKLKLILHFFFFLGGGRGDLGRLKNPSVKMNTLSNNSAHSK